MERCRTGLSQAAGADAAQCLLCPHACNLNEGKSGICRARAAQGGAVVPLAYGQVVSLALDPVEKKPFAHFHPGATVLSAGFAGCNMRCPFCQNAEISQVGPDELRGRFISAERLVSIAEEERSHGNIGIACTYNEPLVAYEYVADCSMAAHRAGLLSLLVSNGQVEPGPWRDLLPFIDAVNIDLKSLSNDFYRQCGGSLDAVKRTIELAAQCPTCHVELTCLVIPGKNDDEIQMDALASWVASIDPAITLHVTRFFPAYRMDDVPATPVSTVHRMADIARRHLASVEIGNCR